MKISFKFKQKQLLPQQLSTRISLQSQPSHHHIVSQNSHCSHINQSYEPLAQFTYQLKMKNKAKHFVAKLKKQKQSSYGKYLIARKIEEEKKMQIIQRQLNESLQRFKRQKNKKRDQISAKIKLRRQKQINKPIIKHLNNIQKVEQIKLRSNIKSIGQRIKTQQSHTQSKYKQHPYYTISDQRMINSIKRKLKQLNHLSQIEI